MPECRTFVSNVPRTVPEPLILPGKFSWAFGAECFCDRTETGNKKNIHSKHDHTLAGKSLYNAGGDM